MNQKISEIVKVGIVSDTPRWVIWKDRKYIVNSIGLHHTFREGRVLYHVFSVSVPNLFMKLILNTENLNWILEEVADGI